MYIKTSPKNKTPCPLSQGRALCQERMASADSWRASCCSPETEPRSPLRRSRRAQLPRLGPPGLPGQARPGHGVNSSVPKPERAGGVCAPTAPPRMEVDRQIATAKGLLWTEKMLPKHVHLRRHLTGHADGCAIKPSTPTGPAGGARLGARRHPAGERGQRGRRRRRGRRGPGGNPSGGEGGGTESRGGGAGWCRQAGQGDACR